MAPMGFRIAKYDDDLRHLDDSILQMLHVTRDTFVKACEALRERDVAKAELITHQDDAIDELEVTIKDGTEVWVQYKFFKAGIAEKKAV